MKWLLRCLFAMMAAVVAPVQAARVALVIGNAAYLDVPLKNPLNDARAVDQKLASLGFKVQRIENLKRAQIGRSIAAFAGSVRAGDDVVVFYAGHGVQVKGVNYLPAVDADIQSEEDVPLNSLNLNSLMDRLEEAKAGVKILFLDACRNNPYARTFRGGERGLSRMTSAPSGTLIHFATRPGSVAADGSGSNGLYTRELLAHIESPDVPVETMLKRVSAAVETASQGAQEPWTEGSIKGEFFFKRLAASAEPVISTQVASLQVAPDVPANNPAGFTETLPLAATAAETALWQAVSAGNSAEDYGVFLQQFPKGVYAALAQARMEKLKSAPTQPSVDSKGAMVYVIRESGMSGSLNSWSVLLDDALVGAFKNGSYLAKRIGVGEHKLYTSHFSSTCTRRFSASDGAETYFKLELGGWSPSCEFVSVEPEVGKRLLKGLASAN